MPITVQECIQENPGIQKDLPYLYRSIQIYSDLMYRIKADNGFTPVARCAYEEFYGMTRAALSVDWKNRYFSKADEWIKRGEKYSFSQLLDMEEIGRCGDSIQASFISKLAHTLDDEIPIYDSYVKYFLKTGYVIDGSFEERKESINRIYDRIIAFYTTNDENEKCIREQMLNFFENECIKRYGNESELKYVISETKKIDFVAWLLGKYKIRKTYFIDKNNVGII